MSKPRTARVRFGHYSPDRSNLDVHINHSRVVENTPPTRLSNCVDVSSGVQEIKITQTGETDAVVRESLNLEAGGHYTVLVTGEGRDTSASLYHDDPGTVSPGQTRIRLINAAVQTANARLRVQDGTTSDSAEFRCATEYLSTENPRDMEVLPTPSSQPISLSVTGPSKGAAYTFVLARDPDQGQFRTRLAVDSVGSQMIPE